jgi:DnaJ-class molecular chaperone
MTDDPYKALGLKKSATADEIKKAYRKIARTSHPDLNPDDAAAELRFKAASAAFDLLKDPETRARFDRGEIDASGTEKPRQHFYREYAEAPGNPYRSGQRFEDFGDASDIFAEFMRQRGHHPHGGAHRHAEGQGQGRGADRRYALEVGFLDAVNGGKTRISLPDGASVEVSIPRGTSEGQTIRLRGKGDPGFGGGPAGDALISVSVRQHPVFSRDGNDIVLTLPISLGEAILGGKVETPTIDGKIKLTIPKGASGGQILRLRGRGVKPLGGGGAGDQRVELRIIMPDRIDPELAAFIENWSKKNPYDPRKEMKS